MKIRQLEAKVVPWGQTDRQADDRHDASNSCSGNFANAPEKKNKLVTPTY